MLRDHRNIATLRQAMQELKPKRGWAHPATSPVKSTTMLLLRNQIRAAPGLAGPNRMVVSDSEAGPRSLRDLEEETLEEGREWTRQRLEKKLQREVARHGEVFPPQPSNRSAPPRRADAPAHQRRRR